jgi:hypothetical protein
MQTYLYFQNYQNDFKHIRIVVRSYLLSVFKNLIAGHCRLGPYGTFLVKILAQRYIYRRRFRVLETCHTVLSTHFIQHYFVASFGDVSALEKIEWCEHNHILLYYCL